jgi:DNA-binding MarR family transcriptional regulator
MADIKLECGLNSTDNVPAIEDDRLDGWKLEGLDFSSFRMSLLIKVMDRLTIRELAAVTDLPISEWRVLSRLALFKNGLTVRQIAMNAWVDRAEVSRAASSLQKRGLLTRRSNSADRRAPIMFLTPAGEEVYKPLKALRTAFHVRVMRSFEPDERDLLDSLLRKMAINLLDMSDEIIRDAD